MAFSRELEEIINATLADGVITEKERAVLHKKAQQLGVDPDEVDVVIDGRLQQKYNEIEAAKQKVRKCPNCGEIIPAMTAICPNCGQVIDTSNPDNLALHNYMEKLEKKLVSLKAKGLLGDEKIEAELESLIRQGKSLYGSNKKINYLISEVESSIQELEQRRSISDHNASVEAHCVQLGCLLGLITTILLCYYEYVSTPLDRFGRTNDKVGYTVLSAFSIIITIPIWLIIMNFVANIFKRKE